MLSVIKVLVRNRVLQEMLVRAEAKLTRISPSTRCVSERTRAEKYATAYNILMGGASFLSNVFKCYPERLTK